MAGEFPNLSDAAPGTIFGPLATAAVVFGAGSMLKGTPHAHNTISATSPGGANTFIGVTIRAKNGDPSLRVPTDRHTPNTPS